MSFNDIATLATKPSTTVAPFLKHVSTPKQEIALPLIQELLGEKMILGCSNTSCLVCQVPSPFANAENLRSRTLSLPSAKS